ncbi:hypothetical protein CVT24_002773 [Panaeolus cyanescens]|uniref:Transmembrane protein n=1 Tax=Panaeolus cyanescens TaxID=181874 RepID=A0A409VND8_9AGAR|nr:hypothetical protein CVT24_002773 [Panaeolus cyanescens]
MLQAFETAKIDEGWQWLIKTFVVLDDEGNDLKYLGNWVQNDGQGWYGGSARTPPSTSNGHFNFTFEGTYVSFLGLQPASASITLTDSSLSTNTTTNLQVPSPQSRYIQWYRSPESVPGNYVILGNRLSLGSIDAVLIGIDSKTPLSGKTLLVDDEESQITYRGNWRRNSNSFSGRLPATGWPVQNTTHETSTVGDSMTFQFTGTGLAIYGLFSWNNPSLLTLAYTLDNTTVTRSYPVTTSTQQYIDKDGEVPNYLFFSYQNLRRGPHTLPSFTDLSSMPVISADPQATNILDPSPPASTSSSNVGAIVGGVMGAFAVIGLAAFLLWLYRRRRRQILALASSHEKVMTPFVDEANGSQRATQTVSSAITPFSPASSIHNSPQPPDVRQGKAATLVTQPQPPTASINRNSKAALFEQNRQRSTLNIPSAHPSTSHSPNTASHPKSRALLSSPAADTSATITQSLRISNAASTVSSAPNNRGPFPPSYETVTPEPPSALKCLNRNWVQTGTIVEQLRIIAVVAPNHFVQAGAPTMEERAFVIVDNTDPSITYNGPKNRWYHVPNDIMGSWYLNSHHYPLSVQQRGHNMSVDILFEGLSLSLHGISPWIRPGYPDSKFAITVDANTSDAIQLPILHKTETSMIYQQFFETPLLKEGQHTIHLQDPDWEALDFMLVGVGPHTNLDGKVLWVDNEDPQIQYSGTTWRRNSARLDGSYPSYTTPIGNSTHQASTPGDLLTFTFYGASRRVIIVCSHLFDGCRDRCLRIRDV